MDKKQKIILARVIISAIIMVCGLFLPIEGITRLLYFTVPYLISGYDVIINAIKHIFKGKMLDENFLMSIATVGAFLIGEYPEGVFVMLFYQVGELFSDYAVDKSRDSIASLMDIAPEYANVLREGRVLRVSPKEVRLGETIVIKAGERIPLDSVVKSGFSQINNSALTGEAMPIDVKTGDDLISGCINISGVLEATVTKAYADSTVSRILALVEEAADNKTKSEKFITKFARIYTPAVVLAAALIFIIPTAAFGLPYAYWLKKALVFLVVSCPCALVISVPLTYFAGLGCASKNGILIKGSPYIDALARAKIAVFDKTGTLTEGKFIVNKIKPVGISAAELLKLCAYGEYYSNHPIALSVKNAYGEKIDLNEISDYKEIAGHGISARLFGDEVLVGNATLLSDNKISVPDEDYSGSVVHIVKNGDYIGYVGVSDKIKDSARALIPALKANGIERTVMLTGDNENSAKRVCEALKIDDYKAKLLPQDKLSIVENELLRNKGKALIYVGDGINDAPVLTRADVGIAMGAMGSDAAIESADMVLMDDNPEKIVTAVKISQKTKKIVLENIAFALAVKSVIMLLGAFSIVGMTAAVFGDVGVSVIAIINSIRAMKL